MKKTNSSTRAPSLRVLQDIRTETEYLQEHPEVDNVYTYHCYKDLPRTSIYFDRIGDVGLCYYHQGKKTNWRILRYNNRLAPALIKKSVKSNYYHIMYNKQSKRVNVYVHRIIAKLFVEHENMFANELDHIDGNIYNNRYDNLEYVTHEENIRRRYYNYYQKQGRPIPAKFII